MSVATQTFPYLDATVSTTGAAPPANRRSAAHILSLAAVWMTFATSGVVFSEPAPVDVLSAGLLVLLPVVGLTLTSPLLFTYLSLWLVAAAGAYLASTLSRDMADSLTHTTVSLFLYIVSFVIAAFVARRPVAHTKLILSAWMFAALVAGAAGLVGYMAAVPGAYELFTKFGRAAGTFKDPNVFGPFLVPPFLYCLHLAITRRLSRSLVPLTCAGFFAVAVLLSFSRGAWLNLALATVLYTWLAFVTAPGTSQRARIVALSGLSALVAAGAIAVALQFDAVADLLSQRASLTQSYDVGPDGRFGGQQKALHLILDNPFGIGAQQFTPVYHHEEVHNVFLSIVLNAGWIGGGAYWIIVGLTLVLGFRHALRATAWQPLFIIAYAAFVATALEGWIIDSDHWRGFYTLMAIIWGLMSAPRESAQ
jgi:O-antigen ligase